jgi:hypothetical protein
MLDSAPELEATMKVLVKVTKTISEFVMKIHGLLSLDVFMGFCVYISEEARIWISDKN